MTTDEDRGGGAGKVERIESWKAIATYLGRGERTVRRWEAELGLPVKRMPGAAKGRVYALAGELDAWRSGVQPDDLKSELKPSAASEPVEETRRDGSDRALSSPARSRPLRLWSAGAVAILAIGALGWAGLHRHPPTRHPPSAQARRLRLEGDRAWAERSPASLNAALDDYRAALRLDPDYAEAWLGLAKTYNLMREFTFMSDAQAYPLAREAARRALALDGNLAEAHTAFAFVSFWGYWDAATAKREFKRALALDPRSALSHHWYATFLNTMGDRPAALREIDAALALDPHSKAIAADKGLILVCAGRMADAVALLASLEAQDPAFLSPHAYLSTAYLALGRDADYLRETAIVARMSPGVDQALSVSAARLGYRRAGHVGILQSLLADALARYRSGAGSAMDVANAYARGGDPASALPWLSRALDRREPGFVTILGNGDYQNVRGTPAFQALASHIQT